MVATGVKVHFSPPMRPQTFIRLTRLSRPPSPMSPLNPRTKHNRDACPSSRRIVTEDIVGCMAYLPQVQDPGAQPQFAQEQDELPQPPIVKYFRTILKVLLVLV